MRKAIKILTIIAMGYLLIGYAVCGLVAFSTLSEHNLTLTEEGVSYLSIGLLPSALKFLVYMTIGVYLLVLSKKKHPAAIEIVLLVVGFVGTPLINTIISQVSLKMTQSFYSSAGIQQYTAVSYVLSTMAKSDFLAIGAILLVVSLSFAIAEKFVSKRHGTSIEEQYPDEEDNQ